MLIRAALAAAVLLVAACGYRPLGRAWPWRLGPVQVLLPEERLGEPELPPMLATELVRQLARAGVEATSGPARASLRCRVLSLSTVDSPLDPGGRRVAARALRLRLEARLSGGAEEETLWRSGLVEVEELWALTPASGRAGTALSEASRRRTLQRLAGRVAEQVVELLETAPAP